MPQTFVWDAENRLIEVRPTTPVNGDKKVEFQYDCLGRRVLKQVWTRQNDQWTLTDARRFVWSGYALDSPHSPRANRSRSDLAALPPTACQGCADAAGA